MPANPVDVPPEAEKPKPWWRERPSEAEIKRLVREIKEHVAATGLPHTWRGHTHTEPPDGAPVEYWGEFDIPKRFDEAPCPCCTPKHSKYRHGGKIAYFPGEGLIRLLGPDCFASLNREGHVEAVAQLRQRQQRERDSQYLLRNLPIVPEVVRAVRTAISVGEAIDKFHRDLLSRLKNIVRVDLWREARDGELSLPFVRADVSATRSGEQRIRRINDKQVFGRLQGHRMLDPSLTEYAPRLKQIEKELARICFADCDGSLAGMDNEERTRVAKVLGRSVDKARRLFEEMDDVRRFVGPIAVATLRNWASQQGCPMRIYVERNGNSFYVGARAEEKVRVEILPEIELTLGRLQNLSKTEL